MNTETACATGYEFQAMIAKIERMTLREANDAFIPRAPHGKRWTDAQRDRLKMHMRDRRREMAARRADRRPGTCLECGAPPFNGCRLPATEGECKAATAAAEVWLDIMPAIPLARSVPVIHANADTNSVGRRRPTDPTRWIWPDNDGQDDEIVTWLVDLDDPQGFAYAIRWLFTNHADVGAAGGAGVKGRHLHSETTDADRIALARAIAEVTR